MAEGDSKFSFKKFNFFSRLDARSRVVVLFAGIVGVIFLFYLGTKYLIGGGSTTGPTHVANAPSGLQSVPGGTLTPEYQRALLEANKQAAQSAQMTGSSALPTMLNIGQAQTTTGCVICSEQNVNVKNNLDEWVKKGEITPDVAQLLTDLANKNVSVEEYAAMLDRLVKEGKLTPEQARLLLEQYKKQHQNALLNESAKSMDALIKAGQLPIDVANALLDAQKRGVSPTEYAAMLQGLVRQGKISPELAQKLLSQYSQQRAREVTAQSIAFLRQMARDGLIIPEVESALIDLENKMVPMDAFANTVQQFVAAGKLVPGAAKTIIDEYRMQKEAIGPTGTIDKLIQEAEAAAYQELNDLLKAGKITQDVASLLGNSIQRNIPLNEFKAIVSQLVSQNKLTPEIAKLKIADYVRVKGLRDMAASLNALQANNASVAAYTDALKRAVQAGAISPDEAKQLMQEYQAMTSKAPILGTTPADALAQVQQEIAPAAPPVEFAAPPPAVVQAVVEEESDQDKQARIQALMASMSGQAQQLVASWQPPIMVHREGVPIVVVGDKDKVIITEGGKTVTVAGGKTVVEVGGRPLVKAGSIAFAVLDTAVNSDYPDTPVLATVVMGPLKGAKLLGKLTVAKNVAGQLDRVALNFTLMNKDDWDKSKGITAYAIDPDTARTVMASTVNYHYLKRFGAIMATSLLQGYANAIQSSASTSTTGIFGTSTTHPTLNQSSKLLVALGQIGQNLSATTQKWIDIPPTIRVDAGVSLGILFMADVT